MTKISVKEIIKNSSILAGAQVIQIIFGVIRTKFVALLLGPLGVGESGLYQSIIQLIGSIFGLGISQSSVKSIGEKNKEDLESVNLVISSSLILVLFLGIIGTFLTILFSEEISLFTFKSADYSIGISFLSISILLNLLYASFISIAQGLRKLKIFALISVYSSIISLFTTIPIYYFFGIRGIVPALIVMSITNLCIAIYLVKPIFTFVRPKLFVFRKESSELIKIGVALALSGLFLMASSYFIRVFITSKSGMEGVGYLNAATAITTLYLSLIFNAMSTDFYPKLAGLNKDKGEMNDAVNEQIHVGLIIAGPIIIVFVAFAFLILNLLYTKQFSVASELLQYQLLGTLFKAFSWPLGFILLTRNLSSIFIFTELFWNLSYYLLTILLWDIIGLSSVGIAYLVSYLLYTIIIYLIARRSNNFRFDRNSIITFWLFLILSSCSFISIHIIDNVILRWVIISSFIIIGSLYSYFYLRTLYDFKSIFNRINKEIFKK